MSAMRSLLAGLALVALLAGCGSEEEDAGGFGSPEACVDALVDVGGEDVTAADLVERCDVSAADAEAALPATTAPPVEPAAEPEPTTSAAPTTTTTTPVAVTDPEPASTAVMPDIRCGTDLQLAQDMVQEAGVFFSRSEDATGQDRFQAMDRNWTVVASEPPAGTPIGDDEAVFYVVKDDEFAGC